MKTIKLMNKKLSDFTEYIEKSEYDKLKTSHEELIKNIRNICEKICNTKNAGKRKILNWIEEIL